MTASERREPRIVAPRASSDTKLLSDTGGWSEWLGYPAQPFGDPVTETSAMACSAVFRCVMLLSGLIAGLPLRVYRNDPQLGRLVVDPDIKDDVHSDGTRYLARLLGQVPFPGSPLTSFAWRELWWINTLLWGNHYSVKRYNGAGRLMGFEPAWPWTVEVRRYGKRNVYTVNWQDGRPRENIDQADIVHFAGPGFDGIRGLSRIQAFARNAIALDRTLEDQTGRVHENAAKPSGMVTVPPGISDDGFKRMRASFMEQNTGRHNVGNIVFADADSKFTPFQMSPEDLATIETRRFAISDICRFFGVPPHLVGESAGTSAWGSGIEQLTIGFLRFTLEAELQRVEHELNYKLLDGTPYYVLFDRDALSAMDATTEATTLSTKINSGQLTPNEARRRAYLPTMPGGDTLFVNSTLRPVDAPYAAPAAGGKPADPPKEPTK